jgi:hypothetical protein
VLLRYTVGVKTAICLLILVMLFPASVLAWDENDESSLQTPDGVVNELYRLICVPKGGPEPDWERVRSLFIPEAVIILRVSKDASSTFTVQGWIDDFIAYNTKAKSSERGFEEKIVRMAPTVFRDIAHILVLYEARMLDWSKPAAPGVDSIELVRKDGRWFIAAITNDLPNAENPIPAALKE